jgi:hypothetical protein
MPNVPTSSAYMKPAPFANTSAKSPAYFIGSSGFPPIPVAAVLKGGTTGSAYSETISGVLGVAPYTFAVTSGALPTGTTLNGSTGVISGTTSAAGTFTFTIKVTDSTGAFNSFTFQITIAAPAGGGATNYGFVS